jgi:cobalt-zinc-cadmium efflux system outer membrane protein
MEEAGMRVGTRATMLPFCLLFLIGCTSPVRQQVDSLICDRGSLTYDLRPAGDDKASKLEKAQGPGQNAPEGESKLVKRVLEKTQPGSFPGSDVKDIFFDKKAKDYKEKIDIVINEHYPPVAPPPIDKDFPPGPDGKPLTLSDLQRIACTNNPLLRQAAADIEAARGAAQQAGAYPNPTIGYASTGVGPGGGPTVGGNISQTIKTGGKLELAQGAATQDLRAAEFAFRRAQTDLMWNVRQNYYNVLVAEESVRANRGLVELTDEVYRVMIDMLRLGQDVSPSYQPAQMAVFAEQARTALVTARNQRLLAWRQLAATMGVPLMPPTALSGNVHRPLPKIDFEKALAHVLTEHTDVLTTATAIEKARLNLRLAQVTPYPDVTVGVSLINDLTAPGPSRLVTGVNVSVPVPIFDQNKGAIRQSQAVLLRANEEPHRVQMALTASFSDAYRRYEENRTLLQMYQKKILPKQVLSFRGAVKLLEVQNQVAFTDLISAEQNLITVIGNYLPILQAQWQAVADVSNLLQTDQVYTMAEEMEAEPPVNFEELLKLPCCHPCAAPTPPPTGNSIRQGSAAPPLSQNTPGLLPAAAAIEIPAHNVVPTLPPTLLAAPTRRAIRAEFGPVIAD